MLEQTRQYAQQAGFFDLPPLERMKRMPDLVNYTIEASGERALYDKASDDDKAKAYSLVEQKIKEAMPELTQVQAAPAKPLKIRTRNGSVLEGKPAEIYAQQFEKNSGRYQNKKWYEVEQEAAPPQMRPIMDEGTERFIAAVQDGAISPEDLDSEALHIALPVLRQAIPEGYQSFEARQRALLKEQGIGANSFALKAAIRGASPSTKLVEKADEWFDQDNTQYNRWRVAYPSNAGTADAVGNVAGLMATGTGAGAAGGTFLKVLTKAHNISAAGKLAGYAVADGMFADRLPGFVPDLLDVQDTEWNAPLTMLEGLAIAGALDLPFAIAKKMKGKPLPAALKEAGLNPEAARDGLNKLAADLDIKPKPKNPSTAVGRTIQEIGTKAVEQFQDPWVRIKWMQDNLEGVDEAKNFYMAKRLVAPKTAHAVGQVNDQIVNWTKQADELSKSIGVDAQQFIETVNQYKIALHAPDYNRVTMERAKDAVRKSGKNREALVDQYRAALEGKGAGMTTDQALSIRDAIENNPGFGAIKQASDQLDSIHRQTLDVLLDGGLIDQKAYQRMRTEMPNHVPLQRVMDEADADELLGVAGVGTSVEQTGIRKAKGSTREVNNIVENVYGNLAHAIRTAEQNKANQKLLKLAGSGISDDFKVVTEPAKKRNAISVFENGQKRYVEYVGADPLLNRAIQFLPQEKRGALIKAGLWYNRQLGKMYTGYNPDFWVSNKLRDLEDSAANMIREVGDGAAVDLVKGTLRDTKDIYNYTMRGEMAPDMELFYKHGGSAGGLSHMTTGTVANSFDQLEKIARHKGLTGKLKAAEQVVDSINMIFEDSTRLGAFRSAMKAGKSADEAALIARNISFDPMLRGRAGDALASTYLFFNPALQSAVNVGKTLSNPKRLAKIATPMLGLQYMIERHNRAITGNDQYRNELSGFERTKTIPIVVGYNPDATGEESRYKTIPLPVGYGLLPLKTINDYTVSALMGDEVDAKLASGEFLGALVDSTNPLGGSGGWKQIITPTNVFALPVEFGFQLSANEDGLGNKIIPPYEVNEFKDEHVKYWGYTPKSQDGALAIKVAEWAHDNLGYDVSPETMLHAYKYYTGGVGRVAKDAIIAADAMLKGEHLESENIPIVRRYFRETKAEAADARAERDSLLADDTKAENTRRAKMGKIADKLISEAMELEPEARREYIRMNMPDEYRNNEMESILMGKAKRAGQDPGYRARLLKQWTVADGNRARKLYKVLRSIPDMDERKLFWNEMAQQGVITKEVSEQMQPVFEELFASPNSQASPAK